MRDRLIELLDKKISIVELVDSDEVWTIKKIAELADYLLKNGVIVPPCKVGDKIYAHWNCGKHGKSISEFVVTHIDIDYLPDIEVAYKSQTSLSGTYHFAKLSDFGKTVFLTREEAEKALAERSEK